ncbi:ABC transporter permease subunit [Jatrophihabitans sp.]|uniref:ABC transporter permease n=1 Tax=Jatrophihabitans sp. TaxID=1932789 RepID=UPI0030C6C5E6|nr:nitrate transporter permease [Jatrophihabitans sp.]
MTSLPGQRAPVSKVTAVVAPIVLGAALIALWQLLVRAFHIHDTIVPAPSDIWHQLTEEHTLIFDTTRKTGWNALQGLVIGTVVGIVGALLAHGVRVLREMAAPIVVAVSVMPIVALGPVLYGLFGGMTDTARIVVAGIAVAIPVYLNTLRGLQQVRAVHRDLMLAYSSTPWQRTWAVTLPTATPYLFTGLRIGSSLAVISALITEYFGGPSDGLGFTINNEAKSGAFALAWAAVVGSIVLGLIFYIVTYAVERWFARHR